MRGTTKYGLPLKGKSYVLRSLAVQEYLAWAKQPAIEGVEMDNCHLERACNFVGVEEALYAGDDLHDILVAAQMQAEERAGEDIMFTRRAARRASKLVRAATKSGKDFGPAPSG